MRAASIAGVLFTAWVMGMVYGICNTLGIR